MADENEQHQKKHVLIVDDNNDAAVSTGMILKILSHGELEPHIFGDTASVRTYLSNGNPADIIITDDGLPGEYGRNLMLDAHGQSGLPGVKPHLPVLLVTGTGVLKGDDTYQAFKDDIFTKPVEPDQLFGEINKRLAPQQTRQPDTSIKPDEMEKLGSCIDELSIFQPGFSQARHVDSDRDYLEGAKVTGPFVASLTNLWENNHKAIAEYLEWLSNSNDPDKARKLVEWQDRIMMRPAYGQPERAYPELDQWVEKIESSITANLEALARSDRADREQKLSLLRSRIEERVHTKSKRSEMADLGLKMDILGLRVDDTHKDINPGGYAERLADYANRTQKLKQLWKEKGPTIEEYIAEMKLHGSSKLDDWLERVKKRPDNDTQVKIG